MTNIKRVKKCYYSHKEGLIALEDMDKNHLKNAIKSIERQIESRKNNDLEGNKMYIADMKKDIEELRRELVSRT